MPEPRREAKPEVTRSDDASAGFRWHPLMLVVLATLATVSCGVWLWRANESSLLNREDFQLTWERIRAGEQPQYLRTNLVRAVFDGNRLADANLLDRDLVSRVYAAFAVHPWVEQAIVRKHRTFVEIDLQYRVPVALVEFGENLLLPVDRQGIVLDGNDFNSEFAGQLLRITVNSPQTGSLVHGDVWPDQRIVAAAMIAELIRTHATTWGIVRIVHLPMTAGSVAPEGDFELLTAQGAGGVRILWGSPPGFEGQGEASADQKMNALIQWMDQRGPLSDVGTSQTIDLRQGSIRIAQAPQ